MAEYKAKLFKNGGGKNTIIFSETEQAIGEWIDGSTLYEKTIDCGALPSGSPKSVAHNINNINKVVEIKNIAIRDDEEVFRIFESFGSSGLIVSYVTKTNVTISAPSGSNVYDECYVIIRYTKTV